MARHHQHYHRRANGRAAHKPPHAARTSQTYAAPRSDAVGAGTAQQPLQQVEIVQMCPDLFVIDLDDGIVLGRPTVTVCVDRALHYPLGLSIDYGLPPAYMAARCLHHAIHPKNNSRETCGTMHDWAACGIPAAIMWRAGFTGSLPDAHLRAACAALNVAILHPSPSVPHSHCSADRLVTMLNAISLRSMRKVIVPIDGGVTNSITDVLCVPEDDLRGLVTRVLVDVFAEDVRPGGGDAPARLWDKACASGFTPLIPCGDADTRILLEATAYRRITGDMISLHDLLYAHEDLDPLWTEMGQKGVVRITFNPDDLGHIRVHNPFDGRSIDVPALVQDYAAGISLQKHTVIHRSASMLTDDVDIRTLKRMRRSIREHMSTATHDIGRA